MLNNGLKSVLLKITLVGFGLFQYAIAAESPNNDEQNKAAQKLAEKLGGLKTYQANFEQRVKNEHGKEIDFSSGFFTIARPDRFRWEVKQNFEQLIIADGKHIFTYDIELEQVTVQNQLKTLADSPLLLLTSNAQSLSDAFEIEQLKFAHEEDSNLFKLTPKGESNLFSRGAYSI